MQERGAAANQEPEESILSQSASSSKGSRPDVRGSSKFGKNGSKPGGTYQKDRQSHIVSNKKKFALGKGANLNFLNRDKNQDSQIQTEIESMHQFLFLLIFQSSDR